MSWEKHDALSKKYLAAESTLEEEKELFDAKNQPPEINEWSKYVKQRRTNVPPNLKNSIWAAIQTRKKRKQRFLVGLSGLAAAVALFITLSISNATHRENSYEETEALLTEALSMFSHEKQISSEQNIIYEDDMIIIYTASNNPN